VTTGRTWPRGCPTLTDSMWLIVCGYRRHSTNTVAKCFDRVVCLADQPPSS
jgi:hypothetical protein